jgi:hypothetical protein
VEYPALHCLKRLLVDPHCRTTGQIKPLGKSEKQLLSIQEFCSCGFTHLRFSDNPLPR